MASYTEIGGQERSGLGRVFRCPGIGAIIGGISGLFFALSGLIVKLLGNGTEPLALSLVRASIVFICGFLIAFVRREQFWTRSSKEYLLLVISGMLLSLALVCQYMAFQWINLAVAITLISSSSLFITIINLIVFKTKPNCYVVVQTIGSTVGCVLCAKPQSFIQPGQSSHGLIGLGLALGVGALMAVLYVIMAYCAFVETSTVILVQNFVVLVILGSLTLIFEVKFLQQKDIRHGGLLFSVGLTAALAYFLLVLSLKVDSAIMTSIGRTSDIAFSVLFDFVFLGVAFDWLTFCGSALVIISITVPSIVQMMLSKKIIVPTSVS